MSEDFSDIISNVQSMMNSGNIPENIKEMLTNMNNNSNQTSENSSSDNNSNFSNQENFNLDINTILKMKSIIEALNSKDDPRANLLYSLKPYLRESRKTKLDQYINLLNITKIADVMKNENKENSNDDYK